MEYPKINSLWKRHGWYLEEGKKYNPDYQAGRQSFIIGDYAQEEFGQIKKWNVQEKIDGTNIRVVMERSISEVYVTFLGRTANADIPDHLLEHLKMCFDDLSIRKMFLLMPSLDKIILFGEGYGPKIQKGGNYRDDVGFILFDAWAGRWSTREEVRDIAALLKLPTPHDYGLMTEDEIVALVKSKPQSPSAIRPMELEGVICRSEPLMIANKDQRPIMWKLKCKEF